MTGYYTKILLLPGESKVRIRVAVVPGVIDRLAGRLPKRYDGKDMDGLGNWKIWTICLFSFSTILECQGR